jgi:murein DD-endopeptidase MepM/ murein hydrolase activator NlpD
LPLLPLTAKTLLLRAFDAARRHPHRMAAGVVGVLGSFAITAFGIAPLAPDAALLPQRLVREEIALSKLDLHLEQLAAHPLELHRNELTRAGDTVDTLLNRLGVSDPAAARFFRVDRDARRLIDGRGGKMVQVRTAADGTLLNMVVRFPALDPSKLATHFTRLTVSREQGQFSSRMETAALVPQVRLGSGTVRTSLWAATDDARLPDAIAAQLIDIFSGDIDFHRELRKGDTFSVVFETLTADDQPIAWNEATGRVVAAEFINNGKSRHALWYQDGPSAKGAYFGLDGQSRRRPFLASPLEFSRITSGFAMRFHPLLQNWRAHNGVDYSAPTGTPVRAVGQGIVTLAGRQNGYGNVVHLAHQNGQSTVYAHLSRIDVREGQRVEQGSRLGAVGATGWATGPHLHFEFRLNGQFQDPLKVARAAGNESPKLEAAARSRFTQLAATAQRQLEAAESIGANFRGDAE